jgi:hypothetical protein
MVLRAAVIITLLTLTACREEQPALPIVRAASASLQAISYKRSPADVHGPMHKSGIDMQRITNELYKNAPPQHCYSFIRKRPREQRASAVQARLEQGDRMTAAFEPDLLTVDLIGDHANILSLEFPVEEYFASVDIEDYMCSAGFAEVRLSARDVVDHRIHPIWSARVTSEGLLKSRFPGQIANQGVF